MEVCFSNKEKVIIFPSIKRGGFCPSCSGQKTGCVRKRKIGIYPLHPHHTRNPFIHVIFKDVEGDGSGAENDVMEGAYVEVGA